MNNMNKVNVQDLVDKVIYPNIEKFIDNIKWRCRIKNQSNYVKESRYPIFHPANSEYFEYREYEEELENDIFHYLIDGIIPSFFLKTSEETGIQISFIEQREIDFILSNGMDKIGYQYSDIEITESKLKHLLKDYGLSYIEIIDWADTDSLISRKKAYDISKKLRDKCIYTTLKKFMCDFFSEEVFKEYISQVRDAVQTANEIIGFQTIPQLSLRHLSDFKNSVISELSTFKIRNLSYQKFDEKTGKAIEEFAEPLSKNDYDIIDKRYYEMDLYKSLVGNEKYAQCFITSEFLYKTYTKGNEKYFDFSSIATGYFKAVELLLEKMMDFSLSLRECENLWIKCSDPQRIPDDERKICRYNKHKVKEIRFQERYRESFSTEMGALIYFLCDNTNHKRWYVSWEGRKRIRQCLQNYNRGCRNEHLHKDIINDINEIKIIRNNTLLCIYYLLGGYKYDDGQNNVDIFLKIENDSFDRLYRKLFIELRSVYHYYIQFKNSNVIKALIHLRRQYPAYDDKGNIISDIRFIIVDDFFGEDFGPVDDIIADKIDAAMNDKSREVFISRNNMPERIWYYTHWEGKVEIVL